MWILEIIYNLVRRIARHSIKQLMDLFLETMLTPMLWNKLKISRVLFRLFSKSNKVKVSKFRILARLMGVMEFKINKVNWLPNPNRPLAQWLLRTMRTSNSRTKQVPSAISIRIAVCTWATWKEKILSRTKRVGNSSKPFLRQSRSSNPVNFHYYRH